MNYFYTDLVILICHFVIFSKILFVYHPNIQFWPLGLKSHPKSREVGYGICNPWTGSPLACPLQYNCSSDKVRFYEDYSKE